MKIYIIILNYNGWQDTVECLESVFNSEYKNYQVVLVDNDSPNNSMKYIINWAEGKQEVDYDANSKLKHLSQPFEPKPLDYVYYTKEEALNGGNKEKESKFNNPMIFIQAGENRGFAAGNNIGLKYMLKKDDYDAVWLLNPDTLILPDTLTKLVAYAQKKPSDVGIIGTALLYHHAPETLQALGGGFNPCFATGRHILGHSPYTQETLEKFKLEDVDMIIGASMLIRREVLKKVGLLEEDYFLYFEEIDYALRAKKEGYHLGIEPDAIVYHKEGASINNNASQFSDFYAMRNRLLVTSKLQPWYIPTVVLGLLLSSLIRLRRREYTKSWMIIKILFTKRTLAH